MSFEYDHERFVAKNRSLASAEEIQKKDTTLEKKGYSRNKESEEASCFKCKMKQTCTEFRAKRTGGSSGVVSFGGSEDFFCDRFIPAATKPKSLSDKQIKSLLKNTKRTLP